MDAQALIQSLSGLTDLLTEPAQVVPYSLDGLVPTAVALPESEEAVATALASAAKLGAAVAPRGAGTKLGVGAPPKRLDLVLCTTRLHKVIEYEPADLTVTVQAGALLTDLQALLAEHGQMLPLDPPFAAAATLGGIVATNSMGPRRLAYGSVRDHVLGMRVALPDGRLIRSGGRVVKNVAGYDMNKLFIGSLGTLGVICEITFKVRPQTPARQTLLAGFASPAAALGCAEVLLASELTPCAVVVLGEAVAARLGVPGPVTLAVGLEESATNVHLQTDRVRQEVGQAGGQVAEPLLGDAEAAFWHGVTNYADISGATLVCKVNTTLVGLATEFGRSAANAIAYAGSGQVYLFSSAADADALARTATAWLSPAVGTAVIERAPVQVRRRLPVWGDPGAGWPLMANLKHSFDPSGVMNPGRFIGGL